MFVDNEEKSNEEVIQEYVKQHIDDTKNLLDDLCMLVEKHKETLHEEQFFAVWNDSPLSKQIPTYGLTIYHTLVLIAERLGIKVVKGPWFNEISEGKAIKKIDLFMKVLREQYHFHQHDIEILENTGISLAEVFSDFNLLSVTESIIRPQFSEAYKKLVNDFLADEIEGEKLESKMLELDTTLAEEISLEQKYVVIKQLSKVREDLQCRLSELRDNGIYFKDLDEEQLLVDLLKELRSLK
ncbi:hypothetical protein MUG87_03210 [Ectobacillus sp. JY-23]|uniref:hypothetical protein n=1 Tax=Ectobacillus sp. JY-23 TaxID=2933872 RepID=UPI001FF34CB3|nr:hypothetical protein [Ectobacillus sp. JY-23]UOY93156.1 hypothetical protein MUG87_03210 [Ectobacillus sp. JY-23]